MDRGKLRVSVSKACSLIASVAFLTTITAEVGYDNQNTQKQSSHSQPDAETTCKNANYKQNDR